MNELYVLVITVCLGVGEGLACEDFVLAHNLLPEDCVQQQEVYRAKLQDYDIAETLQCIPEVAHDWN